MDMLTAEIVPALDYGFRSPPGLTLIGDSAAPSDMADGVVRTGARLSASIDFARFIADAPRSGALILDARHDAGAVLDAALETLDTASARGRNCLVVATLATVDIVMAHVRDGGVDMMIDPGVDELRAGIARFVARDGATLLRETGDAEGRRLADLREEVGRIGRHLSTLAGEAPDREGHAPAQGVSDGAMVRSILRMRRLRDQLFGDGGLFADPAWDILLDLTAARHENRAVAVSSLCIAAAVPPTTALRWIATMTDQGLLVRRSDPADGRRAFVAMGEGIVAAMSAYLAAARRVMLPA